MNDLLLDDAFDFAIVGGDLVVGESTRQHQQLLLLATPGEFRQFPAVGVGIGDYLLDGVGYAGLNSTIKRSYEADGMTVRKISNGKDGTLEIDAFYE